MDDGPEPTPVIDAQTGAGLPLVDPTPLRFTGAVRMVPDTEHVPVGGLQFDVDSTGITATGPTGEVQWSAEWAQVIELATPERSAAADGGVAVVVAVTTRTAGDPVAGQAPVERFVVPTVQPAAVEEALYGAARYRGIATGPPPDMRAPEPITLVPAAPPVLPAAEPAMKRFPDPVEDPEVGTGAETGGPEAADPGGPEGAVAEAPSVETATPEAAGPEATATDVRAAGPEVHAAAPEPSATVDRRQRSLPWWVVAPAVVLTAAVVTVLLLAAGHVIHP